MYTKLSERLGIKDHSMVLNLMITKVATNLKVYGACDDIIQATLGLFQVRTCHTCCHTPCLACWGGHSTVWSMPTLSRAFVRHWWFCCPISRS